MLVELVPFIGNVPFIGYVPFKEGICPVVLARSFLGEGEIVRFSLAINNFFFNGIVLIKNGLSSFYKFLSIIDFASLISFKSVLFYVLLNFSFLSFSHYLSYLLIKSSESSDSSFSYSRITSLN